MQAELELVREQAGQQRSKVGEVQVRQQLSIGGRGGGNAVYGGQGGWVSHGLRE